MAKASGVLGYVIEVTDDETGITSTEPTEVRVKGDMLRNNPRVSYPDNVNGQLTMSMSFSFIADQFAIKNATSIRYLIINGQAWTVNTIQILRPRLRVELGGVYNGKTKAGS